MKLKSKLIFLCAVPLAGLALTILASFLVTNDIRKNMVVAKDESAVFADLARTLQFNVVQVQQFLTDISATRGQDGLDDGFKEAEEHRNTFIAGVKKFRDLYESKHNSVGLAKIDALSQAFTSYYETGHRMAEAYVKDGTTAGNKHMGEFDEAAERLTKALDPFVEEQLSEFNGLLAHIATLSRATNTAFLSAGVALTLLTFAFAAYSIRSIVRPIERVAGELVEGAERNTQAAAEVSSASHSIAEGASQQAASLEDTSSSVTEITSVTKRNAENARNAKVLAAQTYSRAEASAVSTRAMGHSMDAIKTSSLEMRAAMQAIKHSGDDIQKIIKTIDQIAFQTNILALNAAVEAARAGEMGRGFGVVADEVRNLAQRSAKAARETADLIEASIKRSDDGVRVTENVAAAIGEVASQSRELEGKLGEILSIAKQVDHEVGQIASASDEQNVGIERINQAITQIDRITQSNAAGAEEAASAAAQLQTESGLLNDAASNLKALVHGEMTPAATLPTFNVVNQRSTPALHRPRAALPERAFAHV